MSGQNITNTIINVVEELRKRGITPAVIAQDTIEGMVKGIIESTGSMNVEKITEKIVGQVTTGVLKGAVQGIESGEFEKAIGTGMGEVSRQGTRAFTKTFRDPRLIAETREGAKAFAGFMGAGAKELTKGLEEEVFPEIEGAFRNFVTSFLNYENAIRFATPIALGSIITITGTMGTTLAWKLLEKKLLNPKPAIVLPGSKYGRLDRWKRWWSGYKTPPMIFDESVKERLEEIEEKTKNIRNHILSGKKITYDNLLLYGKPGTGKTLFAQILADETDMDFLPVTAASLLQSGIEGLKYFDELLDMARRSKYGVIIFVDEADALFVNRDTLDPESDHYKLLNHILAATGSGSDKFMLIAATNHAYVMDPAMGRRFQDRVEMPLPNEETRKELLNIYIKEQLFNPKQAIAQSIQAAKKLLTDQRINEIAKQTAGLSHAEIKDMVVIMGKKANATKDGILTERNIQSAVNEAIGKMQALEKDRMELEAKKQKLKTPAPALATGE